MVKDENYWKDFGDKFKNSIEQLIIEEVDRRKNVINDDLIQEIIEQADHANKLTNKMPDHHNDYEFVKQYIKDDNNKCPLVITGSSGAGKSSLMAFAAKKVKFTLIYF